MKNWSKTRISLSGTIQTKIGSEYYNLLLLKLIEHKRDHTIFSQLCCHKEPIIKGTDFANKHLRSFVMKQDMNSEVGHKKQLFLYI